jgi:hypothetical protein
MGLLRPKTERKKKARLPEYRFLTCPMNGHQVSFCRGLCEPIDSRGMCGRYVPENLVGRTQAAIAKQRGVHNPRGYYHSRYEAP